MAKKYYTPELKEFHKGFEFEMVEARGFCFVDYGTPEQKNETVWSDDFKRGVFGVKDVDVLMGDSLNSIRCAILEKKCRVKYLDKEDLLELGFDINFEKIEPYGTYYKGIFRSKTKGDTELWYSFLKNSDTIFITLKNKQHNGNCRLRLKNKSELETIMIQTEII